MTGTGGGSMAERLVEICPELRADELRVLLLVAERLVEGRARYGALHLNSDHRNFRLGGPCRD